MTKLQLNPDDPFCLVFSADFRLAHPNFTDDQTWILNLSSGEPPALAFSTTFGLRARLMRYFPRFIRKTTDITDPSSFFHPPVFKSIFPNSCQVQYWPFAGIEITADYLVVESNIISGRVHIKNQNILAEKFQLEWVGQLIPLSPGEGITIQQRGGQSILNGACENLSFTCTSAQKTYPGKGPFPSLAFEVNLPPSNQTEFTWQCVSTVSKTDRTQQKVFSLPAILARTVLTNESECVEIETGVKEWDTVLGLAQSSACRMFFPGNNFLPNASFVLVREPDFGFSNRGDGSDHPFLWKGQTVFDSYYLGGFLLPGGANHLRGVVDNFLKVQTEDGRIDCRPGLAGRLSRSQAQPMLASLAWKIFQSTGDKVWLAEAYPGLLRFFNSWLAAEQDSDHDGYPEWASPLESALEDNPLFNRHTISTDGWEISLLRSPGLVSMLFCETQSLLRISRAINESNPQELLIQKATEICQGISSTWQDKAKINHYQDGVNPSTHGVGKLAAYRGSGTNKREKNLPEPSRLILKCTKSNGATRAGYVRITGENSSGITVAEEISSRSWIWSGEIGCAITENIFLSIQQVERSGFERDDLLVISGADCSREDISLLLGLWAGALDPKRAKQLVLHTIPERFRKPFGLIDFVEDKKHSLPESFNRVDLPWNSLILEGYLNYGFRSQAAEIYSSLMQVVVNSLKTDKAYYQYYDPKTGAGKGQRNHLHGLPSPGLFLQIAGIYQIGENQVLTRDFNAFPFTVTVKYHGMTITSKSDTIEISFPGGQSARVDTPGFHRINLL